MTAIVNNHLQKRRILEKRIRILINVINANGDVKRFSIASDEVRIGITGWLRAEIENMPMCDHPKYDDKRAKYVNQLEIIGKSNSDMIIDFFKRYKCNRIVLWSVVSALGIAIARHTDNVGR